MSLPFSLYLLSPLRVFLYLSLSSLCLSILSLYLSLSCLCLCLSLYLSPCLLFMYLPFSLSLSPLYVSAFLSSLCRLSSPPSPSLRARDEPKLQTVAYRYTQVLNPNGYNGSGTNHIEISSFTILIEQRRGGGEEREKGR